MFHTFNDGKSFHIDCKSAINQHQANLLVKELDKNLDAKYLRMIESVEPAHYQEGFYVNMKDHLITTKNPDKLETFHQAVWEAGEYLFLDLHNLGDDECSMEVFEPISKSADDVEQAINYYIEAHKDLGYTCPFDQIEEHFECYEDETINQRVQDYKPVYLFTKEETA